MGVRRLVVEVDAGSMNVTEFCAAHGISTWFFYDLRKRFKVEGEAALMPKSRAAHRVANRTPIVVEDAIIAKRKDLEDSGLDAGPATIWFHLQHLEGVPSESTIWRILKARGFITPDPSKAPKHAWGSFVFERANESWQLDDTRWEMPDGSLVKILNVIDDHSRLLVVSKALRSCDGETALEALAEAATVLGWPARIQSDNAPAFRHILAAAVGAMGIGSAHSRPYHPQTNGKVERFHLTLKKWLAKQTSAETIEVLQGQLDIFRHIYNHERPHRSLGRRFPAQTWVDAPKSGPADQPINAATMFWHRAIHDGRVRIGTRESLASIGAQHNHKFAAIILTGPTCHIFVEGRLVRTITNFDHTRQTHYNHPKTRKRKRRKNTPPETVREAPRLP